MSIPRDLRLGHTAVALTVVVVAALSLTACGSSPSASTSTTTTTGASPLGATLRTGEAAGLGSVVVDARGYTVYVLSSGSTKNLPCTASSGCTAAWHPVELSAGTSVHASAGVQPHLVGAVTVSGVTYATYHGWRLYEFSGDTGPRQSGGEGLKSFGGTWHALGASGNPVETVPVTSTTSAPTYPGY